MVHLRMRAGALTAATLALLTACGSGGDDSGSSSGGSLPKEITIGVALPTTGGSAVLGEPMTHGIEMAVKEINDGGGIDGSTLKVSQVDTGADDTSALNAFNRVIDDKPAAVIGFPVSTQGFAVATQVERSQIPVLMGGTNPGLADAGDWIFQMTTSDRLTSTAAAEFAAKKLGVTKVALLRESGELGSGASKVIAAAADKYHFKVVDEETFQTGDVDLSSQANALAKSDAQMLFVYGQQADFIVVSNALATAGVQLPTFVAGLQPGTYAQLNQAGFKEIYNRNQCVPSAATEGPLKEWSAKYQQQYGKAPTEYAAIAYDGMNLLGDAIKKAKSADPKAIKDALNGLPDSEGVCGAHGSSKSGALSFGVTIGHYEGGSYVPDEQLTVKPE
jgi:branched-chain amino acid transport system substrate-binding protein